MWAYDAVIVYSVIIFIIVSLYFDILGSGFTFLIGVTVLGIFGILTPKEMLIGASNEQIANIIMLLLLGKVFQKTSLLNNLFDRFFKNARTYRGFIAREMMLISPMSAFMNNTPLVALMMPYAYDWAKKNHQPISKILIPLSYASILGGTATLIGTSTNMIVNGMAIEDGINALHIFDFFPVGGTMIVLGFLYMYFIGHRLLPEKWITSEKVAQNAREYVVEIQITEGSDLIGKTIEEANLRNLKGLFLFQIIRNGRPLPAVPNDTILIQKDILFFAGEISSIADLLNLHKNLRMPSVGMFGRKKNLDIIEVVIPDKSPLVGKTLKTENFRAKYDAAVIAIHRNGEKINRKLGTVRLKPGDTLLLLAGDKFAELTSDTRAFYIISKVKEIRKLTSLQSWVLVMGTIGAIVLSALGILKLFVALLILLSVLLIMNITNPKELQRSIDYNLAFIIAMALALGLAMRKSGVADILANLVIDIFRYGGELGILIGIYLITSILAAFVTNTAAVAIVFPIAMSVAADMGHQYTPYLLILAYAAAANFMTPIGYQTNTMIYGPGGYKFNDFLRVGAPLTILYAIVAITIISLKYF